ncbi:hypothetical protein D3218_13100 [Aureimonas flava]|uniref:Uncharacterized protein n=1 Tax=Aureimonas flava TaxID=2320271 RepID=A0A3A1WJ02_9HYPH|nr:hypothetical protein D3218_13100 [Aureimonas flava]
MQEFAHLHVDDANITLQLLVQDNEALTRTPNPFERSFGGHELLSCRSHIHRLLARASQHFAALTLFATHVVLEIAEKGA